MKFRRFCLPRHILKINLERISCLCSQGTRAVVLWFRTILGIRIHQALLKKLFALSLLLLVGLISTSLLYDLASNLISDVAVPESRFKNNAVELSPPFYGISKAHSTTRLGWKDRSHLELYFQVRQLIPTHGRVAGSFTLRIPKVLEDELWDVQRKNFVILSVTEKVSGENAFYQEIPLKNFLPSRDEASEDWFDFDIPVEFSISSGSPQAYPSDWYWTYNFIDILQPPAFYLPFELMLQSSTEMADKKIVFTQHESPYFGLAYLNLLITRNDSTKRFVYTLALLPLALCLFLGYLLFFFQQSRRESESIHLFILEIAAVMLAVLPLRQVIVPLEIQGLTRIDFILGMELAAIVCLAMVRFSIQMLYPSIFSRSKVVPKTKD